MDKFVYAKKPSAVRHDKDDAKNDRHKFRYNPYGVNKANERKLDEWKDKKKMEKYAHNASCSPWSANADPPPLVGSWHRC